ncbi:MAG: glycosyltransferase family protein [Hyphomicrobiales bacterium]|nr:glycosyltransferase family protein [Hyphomicrobiales bacterium]
MTNGSALSPDLINTLNQALSLHRSGQHAKAEELYRHVLAAHPQQFEALHFYGLLEAERGQLKAADELIARSLKVNRQRPEAFANYARVLNRLKRPQEALSCCDTALAMNPRMPEAWVNRGIALQKLERFAEALDSQNKALALQPNYAVALINRGVSLNTLGRYEDALADFERALSSDPRNDAAMLGRGSSLQALHRLDEALACYQHVLATGQGSAEIHRSLGIALYLLDRCDEAVTHLQQALALDPADDEARASLCTIHLSFGRFGEGWPLHDSRFRIDAQPRPYPQPQWTGERLAGPLLVWAEQGLGDQILYSSTITDIAARAGAVVMEIEPRLVDLFRRSFPGMTIEPMQKDLYRGTIQAHVPIASLPHFVRHDWSDFLRSRRAYLVADADRTAALRRRLAGDGRKVVGLSWRSVNPRFERAKSAQLRDFAPVLRLPNCRFIDLQYGDTAPDRDDAWRTLGVRVEHLDDVDNTRDIDGLAALMGACDLVVTVSNTTAHLAGALGRPTVVFVPFGHARGWFWFRDRDDSVWYPDVYVARQLCKQSWNELIASHIERLVQHLHRDRDESGRMPSCASSK